MTYDWPQIMDAKSTAMAEGHCHLSEGVVKIGKQRVLIDCLCKTFFP